MRAYDATCPHLHCQVRGTKDGFLCPCHQGKFDENGKVIGGPPKSDLKNIDVRLFEENGEKYWIVGKSSEQNQQKSFQLGNYGVLALDITATKNLIDNQLSQIPSISKVKLLRTTSVMVVRLWLHNKYWDGPDSGVFDGDDFLDNFFYLNSFQDEFANLSKFDVLECHIGDSELIEGFDDLDIIDKTINCLKNYFRNIDISRVDKKQTKVLRHQNVFSLFAPGDLRKTPRVQSDDRDKMYFAGDWIASEYRSWFMERATITALEACNKILSRESLPTISIIPKPELSIIPKILGYIGNLWFSFINFISYPFRA